MEARPTPRDLMRAAMLGHPAGRIPTMPQITPHMAIRAYQPDYGRDWIDGLRRWIEDPAWAYRCVIRLVEELDCDGLRLFVEQSPGKVERLGDDLVVFDPHTGTRIGRIDTMAGRGFVSDAPLPPVETLAEAACRLNAMTQEFSDDKIDYLRNLRQQIPTRFVASMPGSVTIGTYSLLRGTEQAMVDLYERPDFVTAVMDMQAEAMIERAEKLLLSGIDAIYLGDPSASLIGPRHFERFCLPPIQHFCSHFKGRGVLIYIHVCGDSGPILEMLAATGVNAVEPLDPMAGVSVADARHRIGHQVALMGGVSTNTLRWGSPDQVKAEAILKCREGGSRGYILAAGCMVPPETPLANLRSMIEVATRSLWQAGCQPIGGDYAC